MNEPIAYWDGKHFASKDKSSLADIPVYTQDQLEEARKLGMQQERALWNLTESTQEIMNTHPVKELTDKEIEECYWGDGYPNNPRHPKEFARAILRKAQESCNGFCGEYECKENKAGCKRKAQEK